MAKVVPRYRVFAVPYRLLDGFALAGIGEEEFQHGWKMANRREKSGRWKISDRSSPDTFYRCKTFLINNE